MPVTTQELPMPGVFEAITPFINNSELWCHRTRVNRANDFWYGLRVPSIQRGLSSTATRLTDSDKFPSINEAIDEFSTRWNEENPMDNARVFIVVPSEHLDLLVPVDRHLSGIRKGLLPGRFVLAHVSLLDERISVNPSFLPIKSVLDPHTQPR